MAELQPYSVARLKSWCLCGPDAQCNAMQIIALLCKIAGRGLARTAQLPLLNQLCEVVSNGLFRAQTAAVRVAALVCWTW